MPALKLKIDAAGMQAGASKAENSLRGVAGEARKTESAVDRMGVRGANSMSTLERSFSIVRAGARIASYAIIAAVTGSFYKAISGAYSLDAALVETSTLINGTAAQMDFLRRSAQEMADQFGGNATDQVNAFYQAISAGATNVHDAAKLLKAANLLATGGVTDVTTAVDIITTAMNAYAKSGMTAAHASDILFTGVRDGKTTVAELAQGLGRAIPFAASLGVSFSQLVAAVAALTTQGQSTDLAVTGVRAAIAGILKPSRQARLLAHDLKIQFNETGLAAKGFGGFMQDVINKTHGNQAAMTLLFGSTEALTAVLGFAGAAADKYSTSMKHMADNMGVVAVAADKVEKSLSKRAGTAFSKLATQAERAGTVLLAVLVPAIEWVSVNIKKAESVVVALGAAVAVILTMPVIGWAIAAAGAVALIASAFGTPSDGKGMTSATYDAVDGTKALNKVLGIFSETKAPAAAKKAIDLANANYKAARATMATASAELAKFKLIAQLSAKAAIPWGGIVPKVGRDQLTADLAAQSTAILKVKAATEALAQAQADMGRASRQVTGSTFKVGTKLTVTPDEKSAKDKVAAILAGIQNAGKSAGKVAISPIKAFDQLLSSLDPAAAALLRYGKAQDIVSKALKLGKIDQSQATHVLNLAKEAYLTATGAAMTFQQSLVSISGTMANDIGGEFTAMVEGTKKVSAAFKGMAFDIVRDLYKVVVEQQIVANLKSIITGIAGGLGGSGISLGSSGLTPSLAGGGFTGSAPRSGGLDGQGGFLAVLHPQETVIDHTVQGRSSPRTNITINQTFTGGVTRADLGRAVPDIVNASKAAVLDAIHRGTGGF